MGRQLQTIYEYLNEYSIEEIDDAISNLTEPEKEIIKYRYGEDLHNPHVSESWNRELSKKFYNVVIPKIKRLLLNKKEKIKNEVSVNDTSQVIPFPEKQIEVGDFSSFLIQLIVAGKTNKEICEQLNISSQQLVDELLKLKNRGIMCSRKYYSDGTIKYQNLSGMRSLNNYNNIGQDRTIITDTNENSMKVLVISDLHFGNELERLDLVNKAYNYCIKNGINIILCGGDLVDGAFTKGNQKITDLHKQVEYFLKNYPYDKNILTFSVAGDHDMSVLYKSFLDIIEACNNFRHDIIIGGYNNTGINIKNDNLLLYHHIDSGNMRITDAPIILHGHSHKFSTNINKTTLNIAIPSLSNINQLMPSALELNLYFNKGYISDSVIKHIYFGEQDIILSESTFDLLKGRSLIEEPVKNVESFRQSQNKEKVTPLIKVKKPLTQIEKFNQRYGL